MGSWMSHLASLNLSLLIPEICNDGMLEAFCRDYVDMSCILFITHCNHGLIIIDKKMEIFAL